jgi:hypothetical protein
MDDGHGPHAALALEEHVQGDGVLDLAGLEVKEAGDDLKVVLDAVVDLLQEESFFSQQGFGLPPLLALGLEKPAIPGGDAAKDGQARGRRGCPALK